MEKKIRVALAIAAFLSFFAPIDGGRTTAAEFFLVAGSLTALTYTIPVLVGIPHRFMFHISLHVSSTGEQPSAAYIFMYLWWGFRDLVGRLAELSWNYAILYLLIGNLFLLIPCFRKWKIAYRIWLFISLISSLYISYDLSIPDFQIGDYIPYAPSGVGFWLNPILLVIAAGIEAWFWFRERKTKRAKMPGS